MVTWLEGGGTSTDHSIGPLPLTGRAWAGVLSGAEASPFRQLPGPGNTGELGLASPVVCVIGDDVWGLARAV